MIIKAVAASYGALAEVIYTHTRKLTNSEHRMVAITISKSAMKLTNGGLAI